jgi:large subunit ribosomal protein L22
MIASAKLRYLRVSPRKANQVVRLIRGRSVDTAFSLLNNLNKGVSLHLRKLLHSAVTNAQNKGTDTGNLSSIYISKATADSGPTLKRFKAAAFGRATMVQKKTSHIAIELDLRTAPTPPLRRLRPRAAAKPKEIKAERKVKETKPRKPKAKAKSKKGKK